MKLYFYSDIVDEQERIWMSWEGNEDAISFQSVQRALSTRAEDDKEIELHINCRGGNCIEGWAIYDLIRQQEGCNVSAIIEGECSSMASIILLAAPLESRKAFANAHLCIHNPAVCGLSPDMPSRLTESNVRKLAEQILSTADQLHTEQEKILDVYCERTSADRTALQELMDKDVYVSMATAQELGFISTIMQPITAKKEAITNQNIFTNKMTKTTDKKGIFNQMVDMLKSAMGIEDNASEMVALEVTAADGSVLNIEREEGNPQVGDAAKPDGTFVLEDGTTIVVEGGVIASITPAAETEEAEPEAEASTEDKKKKCEAEAEGEQEEEPKAEPEAETKKPAEDEELKTKLSELEQENAELKTKLDELAKMVEELTKKQPTAEDIQTLQMVSNAGGKEAVEKAISARSTAVVNNTKPIEQKMNASKEDWSGENYIESRKAAHAAALAKIRK